MAQVPSLTDTAMLPAIWGTETLTMVMSSTAMKLAIARTPMAATNASPVSGAGPALVLIASAAMVRLLVRKTNLGRHRQAHAQRMLFQFLGIERDAHGKTLHHLDPIAGGVLRRDQREGRAGAAAQTHDMTVEDDIGPIKVGRQRHVLTRAHAFELAFLEIGVDIGLLDRRHRH